MRRLIGICLAVLVLFSSSALAENKTVVLTSLSWPPYSSEKMQGGGASIHVVRTALAAVGFELEVIFYPWQRTVHEARRDKRVDGFFPEYYSKERTRSFFYSDPVGWSPVGFAEHWPGSRHWRTLDDLKEYRIGVVDGYINYGPFDAMVAKGEIRTDGSVSDTTNLRKVLAGRVDMAVVDKNSFDYLTRHDPILSKNRENLVFRERLLNLHELFVCFKKTPRGEFLVSLLNKGLSLIDVSQVHAEYIRSITQ